MTALWPELLVLVLFLAGDLFWDGLESAGAGAAAGLLSFLILLFFRRRKPGLILEGLLFGGITALGETVAVPGGTLILMELILGFLLLVSSLFHWNIMEKMAGEMGRGLVSSPGQGILTAALGGVFLLHGFAYIVLKLSGAGGLLWGIILFAVLYLTAFRFTGKRIRRANREELPEILRDQEGNSVLKNRDTVLGIMSMNDSKTGTATVSPVEMMVPPDEFLKNLERCLRKEGFRFLVLDNWREDVLELQMDGFLEFQGSWRKPL